MNNEQWSVVAADVFPEITVTGVDTFPTAPQPLPFMGILHGEIVAPIGLRDERAETGHDLLDTADYLVMLAADTHRDLLDALQAMGEYPRLGQFDTTAYLEIVSAHGDSEVMQHIRMHLHSHSWLCGGGYLYLQGVADDGELVTVTLHIPDIQTLVDSYRSSIETGAIWNTH